MRNLANTVDGAHLLLGVKFDSQQGQEEMKRHFCRFVKLDSGFIGVKVMYAFEQKTFTMEQIVGMQLQKMKEIAEKAQGVTVRDVVISCPGGFTSQQRQALLDAAAIAGLNPLRIIDEHTATAISYGIYKRDFPETEELAVKTLIIDVGASTTSASVYAFTKNKMTCLGAAFDSNLGGRDVDKMLADHYTEEFNKKYKLNISSNQRAQARLIDASERLKKVLNSTPEGVMNIDSFMDDIDVTGRMTRDDFEKLLASSGYLDRSLAPIKRVLEATGLKPNDFGAIEVCGSGTRLLALQRAIESFLGREVQKTINTEEHVARGAALQCAILSPLFKVREYAVEDAVQYPIEARFVDASGQPFSESMQLFKAGAIFPKDHMITQFSSGPWELQLWYTDGVPADDALIATYRIPKVADGAKLKLRAGLDIHGVARLASVQHLTTIEVAEPAPATPTPASPAPAPGTPEAPAGSDPDKPQAAAPAEPPAPVIKKKVVKTDVVYDAIAAGLSRQVRESFAEDEGKMVAADRLSVETGEARNSLETYVYDMRDKLSSSLSSFAQPAETESLRKLFQAEEEWLYTDEAAEATKSGFVARLVALRKIGDPIETRKRESESRPDAIRGLRAALETFANFVKSSEAKWEHISPEDRQTVKERCASAEAWLQAEVAKQESLPANADPILTTAAVQAKKVSLEQYCNPIMNKPKPAPKKEEPKKDEKKEEKKDDKKEEPKTADGSASSPEPPQPSPVKDDMEVD